MKFSFKILGLIVTIILSTGCGAMLDVSYSHAADTVQLHLTTPGPTHANR